MEAKVITAENQGRLAELDSLRGFAAIGVLCLHTMTSLFFWAWSCVDFFFVLSGFLITSILLHQAKTPRDLPTFFMRRVLRIWPVYYLTWALAAFLQLAYAASHDQSPTLPAGHWMALAFVQNTEHYIPGAGPVESLWFFAHGWSLAVEEQFYLLWPLIVVVLRPRRRVLTFCAIAMLVAANLARANGQSFYLLSTRVDGLIFGIALAYAQTAGLLHPQARSRWLGPALMLAGLMLLLPYLSSLGRHDLFGVNRHRGIEVTAFAMFYAGAVAVAISWRGSGLLAPLRWPALLHLGRISFATYMFQVPIAFVLLLGMHAGLYDRLAVEILIWVLTLTAAQLSYRYIERPMESMKRHFRYRAAPQPAAAEHAPSDRARGGSGISGTAAASDNSP